MSITAGIAIYFVLWWVVLFAVLPWGVKSQHEGGAMEAGTDPGAPQRALLLPKVIVTTVISMAIFAAGYWAWRSGLIPLERIPMPFNPVSR
jgi:predicted secreted protein